jgi:hypothetical protein
MSHSGSTGDAGEVKKLLTVLALAIGVITGMVGLLGAWLVLPTKMELMNARVVNIEQKQDRDHDLLTRIEERLISVQREARAPKQAPRPNSTLEQ